MPNTVENNFPPETNADAVYTKKNININDIILQEEEVEDIKWATREEIEQLIEDDKFSKSHEEFYRYCLEFLEK